MNSYIQANTIADIIYRQVVGNELSSSDIEILDKWRHQSERHEKLYSQLTDYQWLQSEIDRRENIDYEGPKKEMERRISDFESSLRTENVNKSTSHKENHTLRKISLYFSNIAAVIAIVVAVLLYFKYENAINQIADLNLLASIKPGSTQAVLTTADGKTINLKSDAIAQDITPKAVTSKTDTQSSDPAILVAERQESEMNTLSTPRGGEFCITLEDGTQVFLNAESQLIYPSSFEDNERRVAVLGEAYFKVAKDKTKPFYVETGGQEVRVYGTEFNIKNYPEDVNVETTLVEGSITVSRQNEFAGSLMLSPGMQSTFDKNTKNANVTSVATQVVTSWLDGKFVFENQTLEQIMCSLSRWYDFEYEFSDKALAKTIFMGSAPRYGDFNQVLDILETSGGLKFKMENQKVVVYSVKK